MDIERKFGTEAHFCDSRQKRTTEVELFTVIRAFKVSLCLTKRSGFKFTKQHKEHYRMNKEKSVHKAEVT